MYRVKMMPYHDPNHGEIMGEILDKYNHTKL